MAKTLNFATMMGFILILAFVAMAALGTLALPNESAISPSLPREHLLDHTNGAERVRDGELVVALYDDKVCEGVEVRYSRILGKIIVLCGIPKTNLWGGMIWRVTENGGTQFLSGDDLGMVTIVVDHYHYWQGHFQAYGYSLIGSYPSVSRFARESLNIYW